MAQKGLNVDSRLPRNRSETRGWLPGAEEAEVCDATGAVGEAGNAPPARLSGSTGP